MPVYQPAISKLCRFTGLNRKPPTIRNSEILKPQVNGLLYFEKPVWSACANLAP